MSLALSGLRFDDLYAIKPFCDSINVTVPDYIQSLLDETLKDDPHSCDEITGDLKEKWKVAYAKFILECDHPLMSDSLWNSAKEKAKGILNVDS